jgi:hypothetical protein
MFGIFFPVRPFELYKYLRAAAALATGVSDKKLFPALLAFDPGESLLEIVAFRSKAIYAVILAAAHGGLPPVVFAVRNLSMDERMTFLQKPYFFSYRSG